MSSITLPSPVGGWNARDSLADMPPTDAIDLVNMVPVGSSVKTRPGFSAHTTDLGAEIHTLVTYHGSSDVLIAGVNETTSGGEDAKLYDVSAGGTPASDLSGGTITFKNGKFETTEFKDRIIFVNGEDDVHSYDGSTLAAITETVDTYNMVSNGTFDTSLDGWTADGSGTTWTHDGSGAATIDGTQSGTRNLWQNIAAESGATYRLTFTITRTAGSVTPLVGTSSGTARSAAGTYTEDIVSSGIGATNLTFQASSDFNGTLDNVTAYRVDPAIYSHCVTHKQRVYYVEADSQSFWYCDAGSYQGDVTEFDLSEFTTTGGKLLQLITWSRDGGDGMDDLLVCLFDTGEVLVYAGSDPGSATDWALQGRFRIGRPLGKRCATKIGGDVIILTVDGYVPLSAALQEGRYSEQSDFSFKIDEAAKEAAQAAKDSFGWMAVHWPQSSWFVVNVPVSASVSVQHVRSTATGAWCRFEGLNGQCWAEYGDNLYFGSSDGLIYLIGGSSDNGAYISYECTQAFQHLGGPHNKKVVTAIEPVTDFYYPKSIDCKVQKDHNLRTLPSYPSPDEPPASEWNVGDWDVAQWVTAGSAAKVARRNVAGSGYVLAPVIRFKSRSQTVVWYSSHIWFTQAGVV